MAAVAYTILQRVLIAQQPPGIATALYVAVALIWLVPDRRIESTFTR